MNRRLEKITRTVRDVISDAIQNHLADPRIQGLVSITRVDLAPDLSVARIYLSIMGVDEKKQKLCCETITRASGFIRSRLAGALTTRNCPALKFILDDSIKRGFEITRMLDKLAAERQDNPTDDSDN